MSTRRSSSTSSGDDDPTPPRGARVAGRRARDASAQDEWDGDEWDDEWDEPNYLIRRALVVGAVVLGIALAAIVASRFVGSDGGGGGGDSAAAAADWDTTIVLTADEVRLLDRESGDEIDTFESAVDLLDAQTLVARDVLVTLTDEGAIGLLDLSDGTSRRGRAGVDETLIASPDNPRIAIAGPDAGGDVTIIDTVARNVFSVADATGLTNPLIFNSDIRVNPSGSHAAVPVPNAFQSFVIDIAEETTEAFAGRVIAISDELVVTEQPAGAESEIEFHELVGERLASVDVPAPRASLLTGEGSLLLVAADGSVRTVSSDGTVDDVDPIVDEEGTEITITSGFAALDGTRLVLFGGDGDTVVVLDENGAALGTAAGQITTNPALATRCVVVGGGSSSDPSTLLDLDDGSVIMTIERGVPAAASVDGCTVALIGGTANLLTDGEIVEIDARSIAEVTPDGDAVIVLDGRDTELVRVGEDSDPIEIADEPVVVRFGLRE
ncbi:MAG: hypothetical protein WA964_18640 [Ilumatobacter sp.]|uniref:hypothetical protein n=1 Tax=Ilumatobacter sp. TaxID=1967498 RepID=UPI003C787D18